MEKTKKNKKSKKIDFESIRQAGDLAKVKMYRDLISRIGAGDRLKPMEMKTFHQLERDLEGLFNGDGGKTSGLISGYKEVCDYLGISKRMLSYHVTKGNLRQNQDGTFAIEELKRWAKKYKRTKKGSGKYPDLDERQQRADLRFRQARARREEMLVGQLQDSLLSQKDVANGWAKRSGNMRSSLLTLVDRLPATLEGKSRKQIGSILKEEIFYFLELYSQDGKYCPKN
jgi:hypothetical protein